jgi:hypothetical protein
MSEKVFDMPFTEAEFVADVRANGFLADVIEQAVPAYVHQHRRWFDHALQLNAAVQAAFNARDDVVVGLSAHSAKAIATRAMIRGMNAYQAIIILLRRGMASEADTLVRGLYETAFWLGFLLQDEAVAIRAIIVDELQSQKGLLTYYSERIGSERNHADGAEDLAALDARIQEIKRKLNGERAIGPKELARKSGLYRHYDAYKRISASAAHTSLNSLHRYLKMSVLGTYDGHVVGPDMEATGTSLQFASIAFGLVAAHYGSITGPAEGDERLQALLIATDTLRSDSPPTTS